MAVAADRLRQAAQARKEKVPVLAPVEIEKFSMVLVPFKEVRDVKADGQPGRLIKVVGYLDCYAEVRGMAGPIRRQIDIETGDGWGVLGEIEQGISPAGREFLEFVKNEWLAHQGEKAAQAREAAGGVRPLPSDAPKDMNKSERMRALNAARLAKNRLAKDEAEKDAAQEAEAEGRASAAGEEVDHGS